MRQKTGGRQKGTPNKTTKEVRELFHGIIEENIPNINKWIGQIAKENPSKALELLLKMSEFVVPKVNKVDLDLGEGLNGKGHFPLENWLLIDKMKEE